MLEEREYVYYTINRPDHVQVELWHDYFGDFIGVDRRLAFIMQTLWEAEIKTEASCQGHYRKTKYVLCNRAYILFHHPEDAERFSSFLSARKIPHALERENKRGRGSVRFSPHAIPIINKYILEAFPSLGNVWARRGLGN